MVVNYKENGDINSFCDNHNVSLDVVLRAYRNVETFLSNLCIDTVNVSISDECISIRFSFNENHFVLDLFFDEDESVELLININEGVKSICSYCGKIPNVLSKLEYYIK